MTDKYNLDISTTRGVCLVLSTLDEQDVGMERVDRRVFDYSHIPESDASSLSYEELFDLLHPLTTIPWEGERSIQALQEQFRDTSLEQVLQHLPATEGVSAEDLEKTISHFLFGNSELTVQRRLLFNHINGKAYTDRKYHLDWQSRVTVYRLAVEQIRGGFLEKDFDRVEVDFTSAIPNPQEFVVKEYRYEFISSRTKPPYQTAKGLAIRHIQYQVARYTGQEWDTQGVISFLNIDEMAPQKHGLIPDGRPIQAYRDHIMRSTTALMHAAFPTKLFDEFFSLSHHGAPEVSHYIATSLPSDLVLPDLPSRLLDFPEVTDDVYTDNEPDE